MKNGKRRWLRLTNTMKRFADMKRKKPKENAGSVKLAKGLSRHGVNAKKLNRNTGTVRVVLPHGIILPAAIIKQS